MKRRDFALGLSGLSLLLPAARAAEEAIEGKTYVRMGKAIAVAVPGKVEVIEFFGYWCPHCNHLEPALDAWARKLPATVNFRRIPVAWQEAHVPLQKLYFGLEALGAVGTVHAKVFQAVHGQRQRLGTDAEIGAFAQANGLDQAKLLDAMNGFAVATKMRTAKQVATAYQIEGVPTLAVNGQFMTSPEMAKGEDAALRVVDALIRKSRA